MTLELRRAMTLVELLVVVGIVAILAGLLFPVLTAARESARTTGCIENLTQLHAAFTLYASDHEGLKPPYQNTLGTGWGDPSTGQTHPVPERGAALVAALHPYTRSTGIWFCPTDSLARTDSNEGSIRHRSTSYRSGGMASWLGPLSVGKPGRPETMDGPVLNRRNGRTTDPSGAVLLTDNLWCQVCPKDAPRGPYSHNGHYNSLYHDGHVKTVRQTVLP